MIFGRHINKYYLKFAIFFIIGIIALLAVDYYQLLIPEINRDLINGINDKTLTMEIVRSLMKNLLLIGIVMVVGRFTWRICILGVGVRIESCLREKMFEKSLKLSQRYYNENKTGAIVALYSNDLQTLRNFFGSGTVMLIDAVFLGLLAFIKMFKLNVALTLISSVPLLILALCGGIIGRFMTKKFEARQQAFEKLSDFTLENFSGLSVIKAFVKEAKELLKFKKINKDNVEKNIEFVKYSAILNAAITLVINLIILIIIGYGSYLVYQYKVNDKVEFNVGNLQEYMSYFSTLTWPMMAIAQLINMRSQAKASLSRINALLNEKVEIVDGELIDTENMSGAISFNHLTFKYPGSDSPVLEDMSFDIKDGEFIGIIGKTGSGKTTILEMILRIYNVNKDSIYLGGYDIMKLKVKDARSLVGYVPQDNFLFSKTIEENIAFSSDVVNHEEVIEASKMADIYSNIMEFKEEFKTVLGERGVTVSGGQKQRISIARSLYKNPKILILDDAVSACDTKTEETILNNLRKLRKGKTTIITAHRISTVQNLDRIMIVEDGKILAFDTHKNLLETSKEYREMVELQKLEEEVS